MNSFILDHHSLYCENIDIFVGITLMLLGIKNKNDIFRN